MKLRVKKQNKTLLSEQAHIARSRDGQVEGFAECVAALPPMNDFRGRVPPSQLRQAIASGAARAGGETRV